MVLAITLLTASGLVAGFFSGLITANRSGHWCQDCGDPLPLRHRDGDGCRIDRHQDIAAYASRLAAEPGVRP
jgi:hypothetical protein